MKANELKMLLKKAISGKNRLRVITILSIVAILLIFISEMLPKNPGPSGTTVTDDIGRSSPNLCQDYAEKMSEKLETAISDIKGVGEAEVILTLDCSEEYIFAEDKADEHSASGDDTAENSHSKPVMSERNGVKEPILRRITAPKYRGALVICDGAADINIRERVIKAVSAALDLPTSKICVEYRK